MRDFVGITFQRRNLIVTALIVVGCCVFGPMGTFPLLSLPERLMFWTPICLLALVIGGLTHQLGLILFPNASQLLRGFLLGAGFAVLFPPVLFWISEARLLTDKMPLMPYWQLASTVGVFNLLFGLYSESFGSRI